jgi:paraquat-inducible protein B
MSKELEAFMKYCPIIPSENNFKYWSDYQIALKKYERELQTFTKTFELLKKALTELEELKRDVKRFMELKNNITNREEMDEFWEIDNKLSKVGKEE